MCFILLVTHWCPIQKSAAISCDRPFRIGNNCAKFNNPVCQYPILSSFQIAHVQPRSVQVGRGRNRANAPSTSDESRRQIGVYPTRPRGRWINYESSVMTVERGLVDADWWRWSTLYDDGRCLALKYWRRCDWIRHQAASYTGVNVEMTFHIINPTPHTYRPHRPFKRHNRLTRHSLSMDDIRLILLVIVAIHATTLPPTTEPVSTLLSSLYERVFQKKNVLRLIRWRELNGGFQSTGYISEIVFPKWIDLNVWRLAFNTSQNIKSLRCFLESADKLSS